jgi:hypothetical protein
MYIVFNSQPICPLRECLRLVVVAGGQNLGLAPLRLRLQERPPGLAASGIMLNKETKKSDITKGGNGSRGTHRSVNTIPPPQSAKYHTGSGTLAHVSVVTVDTLDTDNVDTLTAASNDRPPRSGIQSRCLRFVHSLSNIPDELKKKMHTYSFCSTGRPLVGCRAGACGTNVACGAAGCGWTPRAQCCCYSATHPSIVRCPRCAPDG